MESTLADNNKLLEQLPDSLQDQVKDILDRILRLAHGIANSNTDSNSVGGTT
jgi:hypothetical protein